MQSSILLVDPGGQTLADIAASSGPSWFRRLKGPFPVREQENAADLARIDWAPDLDDVPHGCTRGI
jgi:hypothetical protein